MRDRNCDNCLYEGVSVFDYPCLDCEDHIYYTESFTHKESLVIDDMVDHPSHYNREGAMECIDEMVTLFGKEETRIFCKLNAWKYRYRSADKNGEEDMKKSDWYIKKYAELKGGKR